MHSLPLLPMLLACGHPSGDVATYPAALAEIKLRPEDALRTCAAVAEQALHDDCVTAAAELLAPRDPELATTLCVALHDKGRDECHFQVAEVSRDPARCAPAGRFAEDCLMHLWSRELKDTLPSPVVPGDFETALDPLIAAFGFAQDDLRPWSAAYRAMLSQQRPMDRAACTRAPRSALVECCQRTGLMVYGDRLNQLRDTGQLRKSKGGEPSWCDGGPLPRSAEFTPDAELDSLLAQRRDADLCP